MKAILFGLIIAAAAVFAVLPSDKFGFGLGWYNDMLIFLKGCAPVIAVLVGMVAIFIGIADMKDRAEAKRESKEEAQ